MGPHAQTANTGIIGQCVVPEGPPPEPDQTDTNYEEADYICNHSATYRRKDHNSAMRSPTPARRSHSVSLGTLDPDNSEEDQVLTKKFR